jgi:hypothetical protein
MTDYDPDPSERKWLAEHDAMDRLAGLAGLDMGKALVVLDEMDTDHFDLDAEEAGIRLRDLARLRAGGRVLADRDRGLIAEEDLKRALRDAGAYDELEEDIKWAAMITAIRQWRQRRN